MPTRSDRLSDRQTSFIRTQPLFFVATAAPTGHVNLSPKGLDTLIVRSASRVVWLNLSGSGNETAAHLREDPRMTLMFCAFQGPAMILRVYGRARAIHSNDREWSELSPLFPSFPGARQIFDLDVDLVQSSCGTGVPEMRVERQRGPEELLPFYDELGVEGVRRYWRDRNTVSIDGRPTGMSIAVSRLDIG